MTSVLQRFANVRQEEVAPVLAAMFYFFCVLTALMILRPARDALGMRGGIEDVVWLFQGTLIVTLLVNPAFGFLVSRFRRMFFIAATNLFFALTLLGFYFLLVGAPEAIGERVGQVFYVWFSVFNLFVTMLFWALMADRFSLEQSKRFFALIAVGGTLGALFGPWLASRLAEPLGTPALLLVSVAFLTVATGAAWAVAHLQPERGSVVATTDPEAPPAIDERAIIGGRAWEGLRAAFSSRYLLGISAFVLIMAIMATFLYFTRLQIVAELGEDLDMRTAVFANIDFITQFATLLTQVFIAGHLMKRVGVSVTLALLPVTVLLGFVGLALVTSLATLIVFEAAFRAVQRGLTRPARETLFTIVSREDKYKSKAVIDTFVYRGGDSLGALTQALLSALGLGLVALVTIAVPLAMAWGTLGVWLGRTQRKEAALRAPPVRGREVPVAHA